MSATAVYPVAPPTRLLSQDAYRLWMIRHLLRAQSLDARGAATALRPLCGHRNPRIAGLASRTTDELFAPSRPAAATQVPS